ncbi:unnamed protein product [Protopolystoma xenopodis]|uniref:Uncharacterized protein n=1 Tax=Protopolystoma xenopodis TaxID=117903 RepID=A0A3S5AWG7_9PLAT|nr:unnamed protein product [Protopolystoma xenopodis]
MVNPYTSSGQIEGDIVALTMAIASRVKWEKNCTFGIRQLERCSASGWAHSGEASVSGPNDKNSSTNQNGCFRYRSTANTVQELHYSLGLISRLLDKCY